MQIVIVLFMYQYLVGTLIMGLLWSVFFFLRKDLRRAMLWSGLFYIVFLTIGFVAYRFVSDDPVRAITPGYWAPPTLFDLGRITKGYGIEDAIFMFFAGGIAAALYPFFTRQKLGQPGFKKPKKRYALLAGVVVAYAFHHFFYVSDMYLLIVFNLFAALAIMWHRTDLITQSLVTGFLFLAAYITEFLIFNAIFPDFIDKYYNLGATAGLSPLGVPIEEYLYAVTFGMIWGPLYSYSEGLKGAKRLAPAANPAKR